MLQRLRAAGLLWPSLMTAIAFPILVGLGTWQMQRLAWKENLQAQIAARTASDPVALDEANRLWASGEDIEYLRVKLRGRFLHDKELHLFAPESRGGLGYQVITPLVTAERTAVLINRGFVPARNKDPATRKESQPDGEVEVIGLARAPQERTMFAADNNPQKNEWYWRDHQAMLTAAFPEKVPPHAPYFVDAEAMPNAPPGAPAGGATRLTLSNRHFEYALTWYGLAITLIAVFAAYVWSRLKGQNG